MTDKLTSVAELYAEKAEALKPFIGLKLLLVRNKVEEILALVARNGIFEEYTKHDITHIDGMLSMAIEIIPEQTQRIMNPSEWLMLVLSIYFHDMGMLVSRDEFSNRNERLEFIEFCGKAANGEFGNDYIDRIRTLDSNEIDRFLYQEYVRSKHADRIYSWITGEADGSVTEMVSIISEISDLLKYLDPLFRQDLAIVCKSHHLDNLEDYSIYKVSARYGSDIKTNVNIHYISIILRSVDLLHITSDRTPSTVFHLIDPSNPVSILEWQKQMAVKSIVAKPKKMQMARLILPCNLILYR